MNPHLKKLSNFTLLYIFTLLIFILLPIRSAFSGNTLSVDSIQGPSFTLYYDLISMDSENLWFATNPSMSTTISSNPFIVFGNLKGCEFDGMGGLNVLGSGGFSFDVFAISFSGSNITLRSISIPSGSTFTPPKASSGLVIGHFSWSNPPQDDETNVAAFEASLGGTKIGKRNQRLLKIYTLSQPQSGLSSSASRKKLTKSNASNSNYKKSSASSPISQQLQDEMPYLCYYDLSINAYGGVYVFADLDSSDIPPEVYPIEIYFDGLQGGTQPDPSYNTVVVYRGKTLSFNVNASNSSASTTQMFTLKKLYVPVGAQFTDPSPLKGGDSLSGIFQWPVSGDVGDGTYTAMFGAYLSSGSTSLFPTLLIMNIKVQEEPANIELTPSQIPFNGTIGGSNPAPQTLTIKNTGGADLNWTASKNASWLTLSKTSGSLTGGNSDSITVSINTSGQQSGQCSDTITISDPNASNGSQTVQVTLGLIAPAIGLGSQSIPFSGTVGVPNPAPQTLSVSNTGPAGTTLNWTAQASTSTGGPWLSINPVSGSSTGSGDPKTITVSVNISGLSAGTYNGTITISDPNASNNPQTVTVTLTLTAPKIELTPSQIPFNAIFGGSNPNPQTLTIKNTGDAPLNWTASKNASWLTLSKPSGSLTAGNSDSVSISVDISGQQIGQYSDTITISDSNASNNPQKADITLNVTGTPPRIGIDPTNLTIAFPDTSVGSNPSPKGMSVINTGGGTLNWSITSKPAWVTLSLAQDSLAANAISSVTVSIDTNGLSAGLNSGAIIVSAPGASNPSVTVTVTLTLTPVTPPKIGIDPTNLTIAFPNTSVGSTPSPKGMSVINTGGGTLNWSITSKPAWVTLSPAQDSLAANAISSVTVSIDTTKASVGLNSGTITVSASGASNSPVTVTVTITLTSSTPPRIGIDPSNLTIAFPNTSVNSTPSPKGMSVINTGGGILNWSITSKPAWVTLSPAQDSLAANAISSVTVSIDTTKASVGLNSGTITVSASGASNSPVQVTVTITLTSGGTTSPKIGIDPSTIAFPDTPVGSTPSPKGMSVINTGGGILNWSITSKPSWVTLSPAQDSLAANAISSVTVSVNTTGLSAGLNSGTITVYAPGASNSPVTVSVTLTLTSSKPAIGVSPASLSFTYYQEGTEPASQTLSVYNAGGGTLSWQVKNPQNIPSWLTISPPTSGSSNGPGNSTAMTVSVNTDLAPDTYSYTIIISDNGESTDSDGNPIIAADKTVSVTLQVITPASPGLGIAPNPPNAVSIYLGEPGALYIWNKGTGPMSWTATPNDSWLSVTPSSGTTYAEATEYGLPRRDKVRIDANVTGAGPWHSSIRVTTSNGTVDVPVNVYTVQGLFLSAPPTLLFSKNGSSEPGGSTFQIQNYGLAGISWTATPDQPWLSISPASGTLGTYLHTNVTVRVNSSLITGAAVGTYDGYIKFEAQGANPYYLHAIFKIYQPGWDFPNEEFTPSLHVTTLESPYKPDQGSWYGTGSVPSAGSAPLGVPVYYSADPTASVKSKLVLTTTSFFGGQTAELFVIRKDWSNWIPANDNGQGVSYDLGAQVPWDSENARYYYKMICTSCSTPPNCSCNYWIYWTTSD